METRAEETRDERDWGEGERTREREREQVRQPGWKYSGRRGVRRRRLFGSPLTPLGIPRVVGVALILFMDIHPLGVRAFSM